MGRLVSLELQLAAMIAKLRVLESAADLVFYISLRLGEHLTHTGIYYPANPVPHQSLRV